GAGKLTKNGGVEQQRVAAGRPQPGELHAAVGGRWPNAWSLSSKDHVMEKSLDGTHPYFWTGRYAAGKMPWDFGGVPTVLKSFLARSSASGKVLIPGCGSGYEVQAFHEAGYDVTAIDFSLAAVDQAKKVLGV